MIDLTALRKACDLATPGPWEVWTSNSVRRITAQRQQDGGVMSAVTTRDGMPDLHGLNRDNDLAFIAMARTAVPELLDRVEALEAGLLLAIKIARTAWTAYPDEVAPDRDVWPHLDALAALVTK